MDYKPFSLEFEMLPCTKLKKNFMKHDLIGLLNSYKKSVDLIDLRGLWPTRNSRESTREDKLIQCLNDFLEENLSDEEEIKSFLEELEENLEDTFQLAMTLSLSQVIPRSLIKPDCVRSSQMEKYFSVGSKEYIQKFLVKLRKHIHKNLYGGKAPHCEQRNYLDQQQERPTGFTILSNGKSKLPRLELKSSDESVRETQVPQS